MLSANMSFNQHLLLPRGVRDPTYRMIQYLVPYNPTHLETLLTRDRVHNHVPMDADKVLAVQDRVLVLARSINDLDGEVVVFMADDFGEGVFDGGVVGVDEVAVDELDCEGGFA
jgi:hypothetical protein